MNKFRLVFRTFALVGLFFTFSVTANALASRTYVSSGGDDINPCSRTAPCKTFTGALSKTNTGGEINCIDPSGYGTVTINKSITIDCEDTQGAILGSSGVTGVTISLTDPADTAKNVRLRGLEIYGAGTGVHGIRITAANKLVLEEIVIDGFSSHGITIETASGAFNLVVKKTTIRNNATNGINTALSGAATATIFVTDSLVAGNAIGLSQNSAVTSIVQNSTFTGNTTGLQANGSTSILAVKTCQISHSTTGINALSSAVIRIGDNIITGNTTGLSGTNIYTWQGNLVDGNGANGSNNGNAAAQ
ncbi:MAG: hypothetical protein WA584_10465 [Pyrinomonadaceae bacterium]